MRGRRMAQSWHDAAVTNADPTFELRAATTDDADFLIDMVLEAVNWLPGRNFTRTDYEAAPDLRHYLDGWIRPTDIGVIAVASTAPVAGTAPIGGCWVRFFTSDDPSYGFVADDIPELSLSVVAAWRGRGVGRAMIRAACEEARARGSKRMSLSVEHGNGAKALYEAEGFVDYETVGNADTMVVHL